MELRKQIDFIDKLIVDAKNDYFETKYIETYEEYEAKLNSLKSVRASLHKLVQIQMMLK